MPNLANHAGMMEVKVAGRKVREGKGHLAGYGLLVLLPQNIQTIHIHVIQDLQDIFT